MVSESSGPQVATLAVTQTITAPTVTERGQDRKPSPSKPAGSSKDGDRKPGKGDKDGKKDDKDKGNDKGPPKPDRSESSGGGKKEPGDSEPEDSNLEPEPSIPEEEEEEVGQGNRGRARGPRCREADEVTFLGFPLGAQWRAWRANTIQTVISAAGRQDDDAFHWINKCATDDPYSLQTPVKDGFPLTARLRRV